LIRLMSRRRRAVTIYATAKGRNEMEPISPSLHLKDAQESSKVLLMKFALTFRVPRIALIALIVSLMGGCSKEPVWTADENENSKHFVLSLEASQKAAQLSRKGNHDVPQFGIDEINRYQKIALSEAKLVQDSVLDKAHPQLKEHFRSEYEKGLELIQKSYEVASSSKMGPPASGQIDLQVSGVTLLARWTDWLNVHDGEIRIPRQSPTESR